MLIQNAKCKEGNWNRNKITIKSGYEHENNSFNILLISKGF